MSIDKLSSSLINSISIFVSFPQWIGIGIGGCFSVGPIDSLAVRNIIARIRNLEEIIRRFHV